MYKLRQLKTIEYMKNHNMKQYIIYDPLCIYYLTGHYVEVDERFIALLINDKEEVKLFVNSLFEVYDENLDIIYFNDYDDPISLICKYLYDKQIYVDKLFPAKYLVPILHHLNTMDIHVSELIDVLRMEKDEEEIKRMKEASRINDEAMIELGKFLKEGVTEKEVQQFLLDTYLRKGASGFSFEPIISFGKNTSDTHHEPDHTQLKKGDCVMLDIGCKKDMYCSDMTRMYFYGYEPSAYQKEIYEIVLKAYKEAEAMCKPGVKLSDIDKVCRSVIEEAGYGDCFKHRTGHMCGMECHDYGEVSINSDIVAKEGMIFSIEPTIMLEDFTIHYENLILITSDGYEVLNKVTDKMLII